MGTMEVIPDEKSSQSNGNKEIYILVVDDDLKCYAMVAEMNQHYTTYEGMYSIPYFEFDQSLLAPYRVNATRFVFLELHIGVAREVLETMEKRKDKFELVLTNVYRLESCGREIIRYINKQFNLPAILMYPDNMKIASNGEEHSINGNVVYSFSKDKLNEIWQIAFENVKDKTMVQVSSQKTSMSSEDTNSPSISESLRVHQKRRREENRNKIERTRRGKDNSSMKKKPRMVWTKEMHDLFEKAIELLGQDEAVPKKIVKIMDVPGLTRENVSSHLQKYRDSRKRDEDDTSKESRHKGSFSLPLGSISILDSLQRNPFLKEQSYATPFQHRPYLLNYQMDTPYLNKRHIPLGTVSETNNYSDLGSSGNRSQDSLEHSQHMYIPREQDFTLYDQTKNVGDFIGLKLANDGKSIEFGKSKVFHSGTTEFNVLEPASSMNQNMILNQYPSPSISQQLSPMTAFMSHNQLNTTPDQNLSALFDCISQEPSLLENSPNEQDSKPILRPTNENQAVQYSSELPSTANKDDFQCTSTSGHSILQQKPAMQFLETFKNDQGTSALLSDQDMDWNEVWPLPLPQTPQQMNDFVDFVNKEKMENMLLQVNLDDLNFEQIFENDESIM
ncbi:unnamed protein product [Fraxinus pennsylvanica]|uniref:HTH myb-type domain-containing protein n=1 Tax=Fraxinus pennsylvanica TaxID=56036 RepID=A0AAD1Z975_9LAMI|nr:unnamed protein product [Fraxinus pennsylvanica]